MITKRLDKFRIAIVRGRVLNKGDCPSIGIECNDLVRIIVADFDLEGFTNFFDSASINKNIVVASYVNSFLGWLNYRFDLEKNRLPRPKLSKFLGDGVLYVWEVEEQKITPSVQLGLMNFCWNMTRGKYRYEVEFLQQFMKELGKNWICKYPKYLRASLTLGHAVKYVHSNLPVEYVSECINVASRLVKIHPELYFIALSDIYLGREAREAGYVKKRIRKESIKGIAKSIAVWIDRDDFESIEDKSIFRDMS